MLPHLKLVAAEGKMVEQRCASMGWSPFMLQYPSRKEVLEALESCDLFHFAGNSKSNKTNPVENALFLMDWQEAPLTVADLSHLRRKQPAFLSFLSTCDVASVGEQRHVDEPIHLGQRLFARRLSTCYRAYCSSDGR
jgi:hypothetical protein